MKNIDFYSFLVETLEAAGVIGAYVALSLVGVSILTYYSNDRITMCVTDEDVTLKTLLGKIKGKKSIYTNATYKHAKNILKSMGIFEEFEIIFDIKDANYIAKPDLNSYLMMKKKLGLNDSNISKSIFFEDTAKNLKPASELGMSTAWIENDFNRKEAESLREYINFTGSDIKSILSNML